MNDPLDTLTFQYLAHNDEIITLEFDTSELTGHITAVTNRTSNTVDLTVVVKSYKTNVIITSHTKNAVSITVGLDHHDTVYTTELVADGHHGYAGNIDKLMKNLASTWYEMIEHTITVNPVNPMHMAQIVAAICGIGQMR